LEIIVDHQFIILKKRQDYISWDEYFMGVALLSACRSKDPNTQVGACIVNQKNRIVGAGYNGLPTGCDDDAFPWQKQGEFLETKYPFVCHAELNAILNNIGMDLHGCKIYTALFPCNECSKAIIQSGIKEVIYLSDKYEASDSAKASRMMLESAGVVCRKVLTNRPQVVLSFNEADV
jgi:dCMP deaminase